MFPCEKSQLTAVFLYGKLWIHRIYKEIQMNILVLGGTRFMGKHLVSALLRKGHKITIATRGMAENVFGDRVGQIFFDRTGETSIKNAFAGIHFDVVFDNIAYCSKDVQILMDHISCNRYVMISTTAVYQKHVNTVEADFDPKCEPVIWCDRTRFPYAEMKRQAERALAQKYGSRNFVAVRFPFVIGTDDYTKRLLFYIQKIVEGSPAFVDNYDAQMAFVRSDEAGEFLAQFADNDFTGYINGASEGTVSIKEISEYVCEKTGKALLLSESGEPAPYNGEAPYTINTELANLVGFSFTPLHQWIWTLIDHYLKELNV